MTRQNPVSIYVIVDPRASEGHSDYIFYVGKTENLAQRERAYNQKLSGESNEEKYDRLMAIRDKGYRIKLTEIDTCTVKDQPFIEWEWICHYKNEGYHLLNKADPRFWFAHKDLGFRERRVALVKEIREWAVPIYYDYTLEHVCFLINERFGTDFPTGTLRDYLHGKTYPLAGGPTVDNKYHVNGQKDIDKARPYVLANPKKYTRAFEGFTKEHGYYMSLPSFTRLAHIIEGKSNGT